MVKTLNSNKIDENCVQTLTFLDKSQEESEKSLESRNVFSEKTMYLRKSIQRRDVRCPFLTIRKYLLSSVRLSESKLTF